MPIMNHIIIHQDDSVIKKLKRKSNTQLSQIEDYNTSHAERRPPSVCTLPFIVAPLFNPRPSLLWDLFGLSHCHHARTSASPDGL